MHCTGLSLCYASWCWIHFCWEPKQRKQYGLKAGLKMFVNCGNTVLMIELHQFNVLCCFTPKDPITLSHQDRCNALASLMFITEKRTGEIKTHGCVDGSKQHENIAKNKPQLALFLWMTSLFRAQSLHMNTVTLPRATFLGPSSKLIIQTMSSCTLMEFLWNSW